MLNGNRSKGVARPSGRSRVSNRSVTAALRTTLGGRLQGNRSRMVWTADENQGRRLTGKFISQVQLVEGFREPAEFSGGEIPAEQTAGTPSHRLKQSRSLSTLKLPTASSGQTFRPDCHLGATASLVKAIGVPEGTKSLVLIIDDPDAPDPKAPKLVWVQACGGNEGWLHLTSACADVHCGKETSHEFE